MPRFKARGGPRRTAHVRARHDARGQGAEDRFYLSRHATEPLVGAMGRGRSAGMVREGGSVHRHSHQLLLSISHAPAVLTRVDCSRPAHPLRTHTSSFQRLLPVARAPSQPVPRGPCARQTRTQQGRAYRGEDGGSRHRRDRLQEGGAGGAYGHQSPCPFTRHLPRTNLDTRACTLMRFPQLQGRHPLPYHANGGARLHRHVLLGFARLSPAGASAVPGH